MDNDLISIGQYSLFAATRSNIQGLDKWFSNQQLVSAWAGPGITFPLNPEKLDETINLFSHHSFVLLDSQGKMQGFGQYYTRLERQHLCRIAVNPSARGLGLGKVLVQKLIQRVRSTLSGSSNDLSLFVNKDNTVAMGLYMSLGFEIVEYPQQPPIGIEHCHYMVLQT